MSDLNDPDKIYERVRKVVAEVLNMEENKISMNSKIIDDLGAESLDIVTLVMEFEEEFDKKIPDEDIEKLVTVADTVQYITEEIS